MTRCDRTGFDHLTELVRLAAYVLSAVHGCGEDGDCMDRHYDDAARLVGEFLARG